jgi:hypothetical protein
MWWNLVLAYQPVVQIERGSWDPFGWERVGKGVDSPENHTAQEGALVVWTNTFSETSVGTLQARGNH